MNYSTLSLLFGKAIKKICDLTPGVGGTSLPGLLALRIDPNLVCHLQERNQLESILITGTNGKTTTTRLIGHTLKYQDIQYLHNRSGSNLLRGVASTLIANLPLHKKISSTIGLWEVDEAALLPISHQLQPNLILFTNLFRDQLDRYGEINTLLSMWLKTLNQLPQNTQIAFNVDDPSLQHLLNLWNQPQRTITYGLNINIKKSSKLAKSADAIFCPQCSNPLIFDHIFTSHLGHYHCQHCNFKRSKPNFVINKSQQLAQLPGVHNLYNLLAAQVVCTQLGINLSQIKNSLKDFKPAFGRYEEFKLQGKSTKIILVKNPTGFNVTLETIANQNDYQDSNLLIILNDLIADGTDVSWIWDVNFNYLNHKNKIIVSGTRAKDLAIRLKYAGVPVQLIKVEENLIKAIDLLQQQSGKTNYILPTYTAMLELRKILKKKNLIHSSWTD